MTVIHTEIHHRRVHVIDGDAQGIIDRGREIESLGRQMKGAAGVLSEIGRGATEEKGRSIERIRDEVGEAHEELALAGERYEPTGTAMRRYGQKLQGVQARMRPLVQDIEEAYADLLAKRTTAADAAAAAETASDYDPDDYHAADAHGRARARATEAATNVRTVERDLSQKFVEFEAQWDTWDEAYDAALSAVNSATKGNITDDWTDDLAGVVEVIVEIVTVIGIVVAIAAIVIGGPIIALVGAVLAVVALIGTAYLFWKGRATGDDLAWAIVGVLPFGRLGKLFQAGQRGQALKFLGGPVFDIADSIGDLRSLRGVRTAAGALGAGHGLGNVARAGLASRISSTFAGLRISNASWSNVVANVTRGGGGWSVRLADEFASYTGHHQSVIRSVADSGRLTSLLEAGTEALGRGEIAVNVADFFVKTAGTGRDTALLIGDRIGEIQFAGAADSWREQLATR